MSITVARRAPWRVALLAGMLMACAVGPTETTAVSRQAYAPPAGIDVTPCGDSGVVGTPIASVTMPTGGANHNEGVICDGIFPAVGSTGLTQEYSTYNGAAQADGWLGYSFASALSFTGLVWQVGVTNNNGGWCTTGPFVQVNVAGTWTNVSGLTISPSYAGQSGQTYATYVLSFPTVQGTGIRVDCAPGGTGGQSFINAGEIRAYATTATDAGTDATVDAPVDAAADVVPDAPDDSSVDAGQDVAVDAGQDAVAVATDGGCGLSGAQTGQFTVQTTINGVSRSYVVLVPSSYSSATAVPLSFVFHEHGGSPASAMGFGLQSAASGSGAIFAVPLALDPGGGTSWTFPCSSDDVAFYDAMLASIESQYCVDTTRVFASGFSSGAQFSETLGCCRASTLRAIAPGSGDLLADASQCTSPAPAFRLTSGTSDAYFNEFDFVNGLAHFQGANHCGFSAVLASGASGVSPSPCLQYTGCDRPVEWCNYAMPHQLPTGWAADTWAFLGSF